jgi:hypothetical protein
MIPKCQFDIIRLADQSYIMSKVVTAKSKAKAGFKGARNASAGPKASSVHKGAKAGVKVTPVRLEPTLRQGLALLQGILKTPVNKLINQAVSDFINKRTADVETDMKAVLKAVTEYRKQDPKFKKAIRLAAEQEAQALKEGLRDPAQGTTYIVHKKEIGPAQTIVQELLDR